MSASKAVYRLDREHLGIRLSVLLSMIGGFVLGYAVIVPAMLSVIPAQGIPELCMSVLGGLAIGLGGSFLVESTLYRVWPSGRLLELGEQDIVLRERSGERISLSWSEPIEIVSWHFIIRKRSRIPKGWYCLACRLTQGDKMMVPYAFIKPDLARQMPQWQAFEELLSGVQAPRRGQEYQLKKIGEQSHLRNAERDRWNDGAEMMPDDFIALVAQLDARLPNWPPGRAA